MNILDNELEEARKDLKKYGRHISIARIILFILLGLLGAGYAIGLLVALRKGSNIAGNKDAFQLVAVSALLALNCCSYRKPFIPLLIFSGLTALGSTVYIFLGLLKLFSEAAGNALEDNAAGIFLFIAGLSVQVSFSFFIIRGTISAKKYQKLQELIQNQTGAV